MESGGVKVRADKLAIRPTAAVVLEKTILPELSLKDATLRDAVHELLAAVGKAGAEPPEIVLPNPEPDMRLTTSFTNIPASEALRCLADPSGCKVVWEGNRVSLKPQAQ